MCNGGGCMTTPIRSKETIFQKNILLLFMNHDVLYNLLIAPEFFWKFYFGEVHYAAGVHEDVSRNILL